MTLSITSFLLILSLRYTHSYINIFPSIPNQYRNDKMVLHLSIVDLRPGVTIELEGKPMIVVEAQQVKPGRLSAFVRSKLRNLISGSVVEKTFKAGQSFEEASIQKIEMEYLHPLGNDLEFLNLETKENESIPKKLFDNINLLRKGVVINVIFWKESPIQVTFPPSIDYEVIECQDREDISGDNTRRKMATLETGLTVSVPLSIKEGQRIRICPQDFRYLGKE
jgi:elongation factor P